MVFYLNDYNIKCNKFMKMMTKLNIIIIHLKHFSKISNNYI